MGDGGHDAVGRLTRIQSRVLHDDRLVGFDEGSEAGAARYRRRILQVIEAQVTSASCRHGDPVGAHGISVFEVEGQGDMRVLVAGIEDTAGFVTLHLR